MIRIPSYISLFILLCGSLMSCDDKVENFVPDFQVSVDKQDVLTTDSLTFRINLNERINVNDKLHARWDWNGDLVFDTKFSDAIEIKHRFYKPGNYTVRCLLLNLQGGMASDSIMVKVDQGFSAPKANYHVDPPSGNIKTLFRFNAVTTSDDEDSLHNLKFRWDFNDDGIWDTPYSSEMEINQQFHKIGEYPIKLESIDPGQRSGAITKTIYVHNQDTTIIPIFEWESGNSRVSDIFYFDASGSFCISDSTRVLSYQWLFPNAELTDISLSPKIEHQFKSPGFKTVTLVVSDLDGLENSLDQEFFVAIENSPPRPKISTPSPFGNIESLLYLNLEQSRDDMTATSKLLFRWDFDGDGNWDTQKDSKMEIFHQYLSSGTYKCILEAEDEEGLADTTSITFEISPYKYSTGYLYDDRDNKYYGTVKIGNQWWMSKNLDFRIKPKQGLPNIQKCYNDNPENCDRFGSLYAIEFVMSFMREYGDSICPSGWHIPTQKELQRLIDNIETPNSMSHLVPNGSSGFNALLAGHIDYKCIIDDVTGLCRYTYRHKEMDFSTDFFTTTIQPDHVPPTVFTLNIQNNYRELYPRQANMDSYYPLRCVKD